MYILFADETNLRPTKDIKFFIYGGLIVPINNLRTLDEGIRKIREEAGYKPQDTFKFDTNSRPKHVNRETATEAKEKVIKLCIKTNCKFIVYIIHHAIAPNKKELILWAADHIIFGFNNFLKKENSIGICMLDNLPIEGSSKYLSKKFTEGLQFKHKTISLNRIKLFGTTCINASHANSAVDIILGNFRYCINSPTNAKAAKTMITNVTKMIWYEEIEGELIMRERGLILRPQKIIKKEYEIEYTKLIDDIIALFNS